VSARPSPPEARAFTVSEQRAITFERVALYVVFLVALIAAVISFVALSWFGSQMGMGLVAPLMPLAIDGFAVACSVGVVRSQSSGERARQRASEWVGLALALSLSIAGNIQHALTQGSPAAPRFLVVAYGAAIPVIVAYGIHVYGRAMANGISAHVLVDARDELRFDLVHLGDEGARPSTPKARAPRASSTRAPAAPVRALSDKDRMRALFDEARASGARIDAAQMHREVGARVNPATSRKWVAAWQAEPSSPHLVASAGG